MTVAFEDRFWGEKNAGYDVLYHNMKYGNNASVKVTEFIRERSTVEENYSKSLIKLAKSACSVSQLGSFEPLWGVMRVATEKLANAHHLVVGKLQELAKEVKDYGDKQKDKHKTAKEEFSTTAEIVQTIQTMTASLTKAKETYYARCHEFEKLKKEATSGKDIEKAEAKMRKAGEDYKSIVERREIVRNEFHDKMVETSKRFQQIEEEHLKTIIGHLDVYIDSHLAGWKMMEEVHIEFRERLRALSTDHLLDHLVRSKGTGTDVPGVITFEEYEELTENSITTENSPSSNNKSHPTIKPGFSMPKKKEKKEKKEKKTKKKKDKDKGNSSQSSNSQGSPEHQENGPVESPVSEGNEMTSQSFEVDEEGYRIRPPDTESARSVGYSSDSDFDSDEDEPRRIQVTIKPVEDQVSQTASADELKKITESMSLSSPASMRRNLSSSSGLSDGFRPRAATENTKSSSAVKLSRSSDDLLDINFGNKSALSPGSDSSLSSSVVSSSMDATKTEATTVNSLSTFDSFTKLNPLSTSSPAATSSQGDGKGIQGDDDIPPVLPKKRSSFNRTSDDINTPPPLPAKRETAAGLLSSPGDRKPSLSSNNPADSVLILDKPPLSRTATTGSALARPRPQGNQKKSSLVLNTQSQPSQSSGMSYSEELFSFMSDLDFSSAMNNNQCKDSQDEPPKTPKTPSRVSYVGSVAVASESPAISTSTTLSRTATSSTLQDDEKLDKSGGLIRSKTVGAMPSIPPRTKEDILPIAVAFIESVNAFFRGNDYKLCMVKVTGDVTMSFPASIAALITSDKELPSLSFYVTGTSSLEQIVPNKTMISSQGQQSGGDAVSYKFNMKALSEHLKKQMEGTTLSYYNIDILKYEVRTNGIHSTPLQLCTYWKSEPTSTNIRIDYRYNAACLSTACPLNNVSVIVPVNGGVTIMQSKPSATWSAENQRALWTLPEVSTSKDTEGTLRARLDLTEGPSTPSRIAVQFSAIGATVSKLNFELKSEAYKLSLVKKQISTGRYIAES